MVTTTMMTDHLTTATHDDHTTRHAHSLSVPQRDRFRQRQPHAHSQAWVALNSVARDRCPHWWYAAASPTQTQQTLLLASARARVCVCVKNATCGWVCVRGCDARSSAIPAATASASWPTQSPFKCTHDTSRHVPPTSCACWRR
jgi:hypothetical protein